MLIDNLWQLVDSLTESDAFFANVPVDSHHAIGLAFADDLNFLDSLNLLGKVLIALRPQVG